MRAEGDGRRRHAAPVEVLLHGPGLEGVDVRLGVAGGREAARRGPPVVQHPRDVDDATGPLRQSQESRPGILDKPR